MSPWTLALLGTAVLALPGRAGEARVARLWPTRRRRRVRPWAAGPEVLATVAGLLTLGPAGATAALLVASVARRRRSRRRAVDAAARAAGQLADALRRITDELRTGSHPALALGGCDADGPLAARLLTPAARAARLGEDVAAALRTGPPAPSGVAGDVDRVAAAWSLAERHGVPLAELLADAHEAIRWRVRFAAGVRAQLAGPRATGAVLTALPLVGVALGQLVGADPLGVLRGGALGQGLLVAGVALSAAGSAWTERILAAAVPR